MRGGSCSHHEYSERQLPVVKHGSPLRPMTGPAPPKQQQQWCPPASVRLHIDVPPLSLRHSLICAMMRPTSSLTELCSTAL